MVTTVASSLKDIPVDPRLFVFGEVGLSGEIRAVAHAETRIKEASKIGFRRAVIPIGNYEKIKGDFGLQITGVKNVEDCLEAVFS